MVAGYVKTRRFHVILPSIDSIAECYYDLSNGLTMSLRGGVAGTVKLRLPEYLPHTSPCTNVDAQPVTWHDWLEYRLAYDGKSLELVLKSEKP